MYDVSAARATYSAPDLLAVLFLGVIGGLFGSLYNYLVDKVLRTYSIINEYVITFHYGLLNFPPKRYIHSSIISILSSFFFLMILKSAISYLTDYIAAEKEPISKYYLLLVSAS